MRSNSSKIIMPGHDHSLLEDLNISGNISDAAYFLLNCPFDRETPLSIDDQFEK